MGFSMDFPFFNIYKPSILLWPSQGPFPEVMGGRVLAEHISERMVVTAGGVRMPRAPRRLSTATREIDLALGKVFFNGIENILYHVYIHIMYIYIYYIYICIIMYIYICIIMYIYIYISYHV